ncbi:MAG: hypothetical protein IPM18_05945 [Phycisphaerales bacterium]|nr:hypothetical protein [Phycisphaerales bacterium]
MSPPTLIRLLLSPVVDLCAPGRAAQLVTTAERRTYLCYVACSWLGIVVGLLLLDTLNVMYLRDFLLEPQYWPKALDRLHMWLANELDGSGTGPEAILEAILEVGLCALAVAMCVCGYAWFNLPLLHRTGPLGPAFRRGLRLSWSAAWTVLLLQMLAGVVLFTVDLLIYGAFAAYRAGQPNWSWHWSQSVYLLLETPFAAAALATAIAWGRRAVHAVVPPPPDLAERPPHCEYCGYLLVGRTLAERCSECGREVADSLLPDRSRRRHPALTVLTSHAPLYQRHAAWWRLAFLILRAPRLFYGQLPLRSANDPSQTFAAWSYGLLALHALSLGIAGVALFVVLSQSPFTLLSDVILLLVNVLNLAVALPIVGWLVHRALAASCFLIWHRWQAIPDSGWLARAMGYETVWPHLLLLLSVLLLLGAFGSSWALPAVHPLLLIAYPLILGVLISALWLAVWGVRYELIRRAIRWGNT